MSNEIQFDFRREDLNKAGRFIFVAVLLVIGVLLVTKSMYTVQASEEAVVLRFGRYYTTSDAGLHFCIPFVDEVMTVETREQTLRLPLGTSGEQAVSNINEEEVLMLTGDLNAAVVTWTVQWQVSDPRKYLFTFHDEKIDQDQFLQAVITIVGKTVMNRLVGDYSIGEVLTSEREEIGAKAEIATQAMLDKYECGIRITNLQLQRVLPPKQVQPAYAAINEADQTRDKLENEANKEKNTMLPKARADRDKAIREAEGYAARRRSEVKGEIAALMAQYEQFAKAPQETRQRLYLEAMEKVLSSVENKTIIDSDLQQLLPLLNLNDGSK